VRTCVIRASGGWCAPGGVLGMARPSAIISRGPSVNSDSWKIFFAISEPKIRIFRLSPSSLRPHSVLTLSSLVLTRLSSVFQHPRQLHVFQITFWSDYNSGELCFSISNSGYANLQPSGLSFRPHPVLSRLPSIFRHRWPLQLLKMTFSDDYNS